MPRERDPSVVVVVVVIVVVVDVFTAFAPKTSNGTYAAGMAMAYRGTQSLGPPKLDV